LRTLKVDKGKLGRHAVVDLLRGAQQRKHNLVGVGLEQRLQRIAVAAAHVQQAHAVLRRAFVRRRHQRHAGAVVAHGLERVFALL
jgi:hypothetical protein